MSQNSKVAGPLGGKFDFSAPRDLNFKAILITKSQKSSSTLSDLWNCYLNEKNLTRGRVMATISKISSKIFETYNINIVVYIGIIVCL